MPVINVIGVLELAVDIDVDIFQKAKVKLLADDILVILLQVHKTTVVSLFECP